MQTPQQMWAAWLEHENITSPTTDDYLRYIAYALRFWRTEAGLTHDWLVEQTGINRTTIVNMEHGYQNVTLRHLIKLAQAMNVPLADFMPDLLPPPQEETNEPD